MTNKELTVTQVNIAQAKARFSELVKKAISGEEVVIARHNKPLLRLVPLTAGTKPREPGTARGKIWVAPDFDVTPAEFKEYL